MDAFPRRRLLYQEECSNTHFPIVGKVTGAKLQTKVLIIGYGNAGKFYSGILSGMEFFNVP